MSTDLDILSVAADLLAKGGAEAVTTRAVCQGAGVTAPTLYHHFGDKDGLLRELVAQGVREFMAVKRAGMETEDALTDLHRGWDNWVDFAFERPNLFRLMVESTRSDAAVNQEAFVIMRAIVQRLADDGRLKGDVETTARTIWAGSNGVLALFMQGLDPVDIKPVSQRLFDALVTELICPSVPV